MKTIRDARAVGRETLGVLSRDANHPVPLEIVQLEVEVLLQHVLKLSRAALLSRLDDPLPERAAEEFSALLVRRKRREPVAYLTGHKEFFGLDFEVSSAVLIPRPETEWLVERAIEETRVCAAKEVTLIDIGTGSGAIILATLAALRDAGIDDKVRTSIAADISAEALAVAQRNAFRFGLDSRISFVQSDLLVGVPAPADGFELILSNPPYVPECARLAPEVSQYEPTGALFAGISGLDVVIRLIDQYIDRGLEESALLCEIGGEGTDELRAHAAQRGAHLKIHQDLSGIDRFIEVRLSA